jgi:hypothetical protein
MPSSASCRDAHAVMPRPRGIQDRTANDAVVLARLGCRQAIPRWNVLRCGSSHHSRHHFPELPKWHAEKTGLASCFSNRTFAGHAVGITAIAILEAFDRRSDPANSRYSYLSDQANSRDVLSQGAFANACDHRALECSIEVRQTRKAATGVNSRHDDPLLALPIGGSSFITETCPARLPLDLNNSN